MSRIEHTIALTPDILLHELFENNQSLTVLMFIGSPELYGAHVMKSHDLMLYDLRELQKTASQVGFAGRVHAKPAHNLEIEQGGSSIQGDGYSIDVPTRDLVVLTLNEILKPHGGSVAWSKL